MTPRKIVEPIREENPWSEPAIARSQTQPSFPTVFNLPVTQPVKPATTKPSPVIPPRTRGDAWVDRVSNEVIPQLKTGDSMVSNNSSTNSRIPPVIPKRTNTPNSFQRNIPQHMSMRLPPSQSAPNGNFQRSQSVRFVSTSSFFTHKNYLLTKIISLTKFIF